MNYKALLKSVRCNIVKYSPELLIGIGVTGLLTAIITSAKATPKAMQAIEKAEKKKGEKLTKLEIVKTAAPSYIPTIVLSLFAVGCIIDASSQNHKRHAALATACTLSETAFHDYKGKVTELLGKKKAEEIQTAIAQDIIDANPVEKNSIILTDKNNILCYDTITGRYFKSDYDVLNKAVLELNKYLLRDGYVSLNDFYYEIGLESIPQGEELGWSLKDGIGDLVDVEFTSRLAKDGTPCVVITFNIAPKYGYESMY